MTLAELHHCPTCTEMANHPWVKKHEAQRNARLDVTAEEDEAFATMALGIPVHPAP